MVEAPSDGAVPVSTSGSPGTADRRKTIRVVVVWAVVAAALIAVVPVWTFLVKDSLARTAQTFIEGASIKHTSREELREKVRDGNILCWDYCLGLTLQLPSSVASTVNQNIEKAGWSIDPPWCLTEREQPGPACFVSGQDGQQVAQIDYWPGVKLSVYIGGL